MTTFFRGVRNLYRNKARTGLVVALLGLSIGIATTMLQVSSSVGDQSQVLKQRMETLVEVRAAGATGMGLGVEPLDEGVAERLGDIPGIVDVSKYLYVRMVDNSTLSSRFYEDI